MKPRDSRFRFYNPSFYRLVALLSGVATISLGQTPGPATQAQSQVMTTTTPAAEEAPKIPNDQLDSLVAPIALYPDPLLGQTLAASTYPLEIIQLQQWMDRNKNLKDQALADAVAKQNWDPSIQAMAAFPDVVTRLAGNIQWTTDLGNAFLAQQSDVMDAIQRMRAKAQGKGTLKTSAQQKVETQTVEGKQLIVVEQANPQVVYIPSYDPVVVYGAPAYPYYPYSYPGYVPGMGLAFGAGLALGAAWGGGWGWGCGWGHGGVNINYNNRYVNNWNRNTNINRPGQGGNINRPGNLPASGGNWQHNPEHRGNAPYGNKRTTDQFGGDARHTARDSRPGAGGAGTMDRPGKGGSGATNRPGGGGAGTMDRPGGGGAGTRPGGGGAGTAARPGGGGAGARPGGGASTRPAGGGGGGGGNRIGGRQPSMGGGGGAFGGGSSGNFARASSSRGGQSMGGGGFSRGGGGGGGRGGGGGGRRR